MSENSNIKYKYTITILGEETLYNSFIESCLSDMSITREELFNNNKLLYKVITEHIEVLMSMGAIKITDYADLEYEIIG